MIFKMSKLRVLMIFIWMMIVVGVGVIDDDDDIVDVVYGNFEED